MAAVLQKALEEQRHSVLVAHTGTGGLELAMTYTFDAVVLDIMLPEMNGFEVARRMRDESNGTPILFLTARDTEADLVRGLDVGADDYLTKLFSLVELFARLLAASHRSPRCQSDAASASGGRPSPQSGHSRSFPRR